MSARLVKPHPPPASVPRPVPVRVRRLVHRPVRRPVRRLVHRPVRRPVHCLVRRPVAVRASVSLIFFLPQSAYFAIEMSDVPP
jgi:hypothetical protein